jgi:hypothetical protein
VYLKEKSMTTHKYEVVSDEYDAVPETIWAYSPEDAARLYVELCYPHTGDLESDIKVQVITPSGRECYVDIHVKRRMEISSKSPYYLDDEEFSDEDDEDSDDFLYEEYARREREEEEE